MTKEIYSSGSDMNETQLLRKSEKLLKILLKDYTTGSNIKWGTDSYINHGTSFRDNKEITSDLITGWYEGFIRPRAEKKLNIQLDRQRNKAEVFTPSWIVKLQVNAAFEDMHDLPLIDFIQTKWLEITCGEAPYMVNRYDMNTGDIIPLKKRAGFIDVKFNRLNENINSEDKWVKLALEIYKASYGYEYQGDSLVLARENLILTFIDNYFYMFGAFPDEKLLLNVSRIVSINVFQMDGLTYEIPYSIGETEGSDIQLSLFDEIEVAETEENKEPQLAKIKMWDSDEIIEFKVISERNDLEMKFDVVLGNPPYQLDRPGTRAKQIYPDFMESSYNVGEKVILITPARFLFNAGDTKKEWNKKMLNDKNLKVLFYEVDSTSIFSNTDIKGGVAITYRDTTKDFGIIDTFVSYPELNDILSKVNINDDLESVSSIAFSSASYRLSSKLHYDYPKIKDILSKGNQYQIVNNIFEKLPHIFLKDKPISNEEYIKFYGLNSNKQRDHRWVKREYIKENSNIDDFKVFLPKSNGSGNLGERLSTPVIGNPGVGHTQTFMSFGPFKTKFEADSFLKYLKTKFARVLLGVLKVTQDNPIKSWSKIPLQDFTISSEIDWSKSIAEIDQQLYMKYSLDDEEIKFIESHVKEME